MTDRETPFGSALSDPEIRVLQVLISTAAFEVQELVGEIALGNYDRERARTVLKACELAAAAIDKAKTPLRRIIRRK